MCSAALSRSDSGGPRRPGPSCSSASPRRGSRYRIRVGPRGGAGTGTVLWEGTTRADDAGVVALHLPAASLPRGEHLLRVLTLDGGLVASYRWPFAEAWVVRRRFASSSEL